MRLRAQLFSVLFLLAFVSSGQAAPVAQRQFPLSSLQQTNLTIGKHALRAWIMDTGPKREEGMMFLTARDVPANQGMLFVFPYAQPLNFWMKNTLIPLDIAFIGPDRRILNVAHMKAFDETPVPSQGDAAYALEVRSGELSRLGATSGMIVSFPSVKGKN